MKRMDFVQHSNSGDIYLVTQMDDELYLWDFRAWLEGYHAYIPLSDIGPLDYKTIGSFGNNPELLPKECGDYNGEPHSVCVGIIFKNPAFYPEYAEPHKYEHSIGYPGDNPTCICGEKETTLIHKIA